MLKLLVLLLLVNCVFTEKEETSEKCKEMFEPHRNNIVDCCDAPKLEIGLQCIIACMASNEDKCSCRNCKKKKDLVPREKDQILKLYGLKLNEKFTADEKKSWFPVLIDSFEYCKPLMEILNETDECQFPKHYQPMYNCMRQQNFLNCPQLSFESSKECEATRKFIKEQETCGTKYENILVFDDSIFDQYMSQQNECEETFIRARLSPRKYVAFPYISPPIDAYDDCVKQCSSKECCIDPCLLNATSLEDFGEKVVKDKIIEFTNSDCKDSGIDFDIWKPVIESSFGICYPLASNVIGTKRCNIKLKFDSLVFCMRQELFLNAPTSLIKDSDQFEKIKTFIANETKCGQKFGEKFIINRLFWSY